MTNREAVLAEVETRVRIAERQGWTNRSVPVRLLRQIAEELKIGSGTPSLSEASTDTAQERSAITAVNGHHDLVEAARQAVAFLDTIEWNDNYSETGGTDVLHALEAALAKAGQP